MAPIDAVRFIANRSSGALGRWIGTRAVERGAHVTFVYGARSLTPPAHPRLRLVEISTVDDLLRVMERELSGGHYDAVIHAMAVLDYVPARAVEEKVASGRDEWTVRLVRTPKVITRIKRWAPDVLLFGFKLEVGTSEPELISVAYESLKRNDADFVVANDLTQIDGERHVAHIVDSEGKVRARCETKREIADELTKLIAAELGRL